MFSDRFFPMVDLHRQMESFLGETWGATSNAPGSREDSALQIASPRGRLLEAEGHFLLALDLPGVAKEQLCIEVNDDELTVKAERNDRFANVKYQRTYTLPNHIDGANVEAHFENGVLTLALPKAEALKPRKIQIQDGQGSSLWQRLIPGTAKSEKKTTTTVDVKA